MSLIIVQSCAIHKKFPFICFRWGCFANQVGLPDGKVLLKQAKVNAKVRKKKREAKRRKRDKVNGIEVVKGKNATYEASREEASEKKDTVKTTYLSSGDLNFVILVLQKAHPPGKDSMYVNTMDSDTLTQSAKGSIKNFLNANDVDNHDIIVVKEKIEYSNNELRGNSKQKEKVILFLEQLGIKRKQIRFKE